MFVGLEQLTVQEHNAGNTRAFVGTGSSYLRIGRCKKVESVRVGRMPLPQWVTQETIRENTPERTEDRHIPMWHVAELPDGEKVILRSSQSNDGIWQEGVQVFVTGTWEPEPVEEAAPEKGTAEKPARQTAEKPARQTAGK